jgi:hypothetical protein
MSPRLSRGLGRLVFGLSLALVALQGPSAGAFGTIIGLGQNAEHERITRVALGCSARAPKPCFEPGSMAALAGHEGSPGAIAIPDITALTLYNPAHCDSGDYLARPGYPHSAAQARAALSACRDWMRAHLEAAIRDSGRLVDRQGRLAGSMDTRDCYRLVLPSHSDKCAVISDLGIALHVAQDFYAHTNWVDQPDRGARISKTNPPGLGHSGPAPWFSLRGDVAFPPGLISGCFTAIPESMFCNQAGGGGRIKHENLEKDEGRIEPTVGLGTTPRGRINGNFARAALAAIADTRDKWALLREGLAARYGAARARLIVCALVSDDPGRACNAAWNGA